MTPFRLNASHRLSFLKQLIALFVLAVALTSAVPGYLQGQWAWQQIPEIRQLKQLRTISKNGLLLPGWQTLEQKTVEIGGHQWSAQAIVPEAAAETATPATAIWLLLRPQTWFRDMPQIDWTDINGVQQWTVDSQRQLAFTVQPVTAQPATAQPATAQPVLPPSRIDTRFFRSWTQKRTNAVLQWYAWSNGGHFAPGRWFWADQLSQLRDRQRLAWVAVSIQMPIEPFGEIERVQANAQVLAELVQSRLIEEVFQPPIATD
jgi:cyanoexosortase B-associated protein